MQGLLGFLRANAWMLIVVGGVVAALFWLVDPAPPRVLTIATGVEDGAYHAFGERLAGRLEQEGLEVRLEPSNGSIDNLRRLRDPEGSVDLALVQSGIASEEDRESDLRALGSLFYEPVWIFTPATAPLATAQDLRGRRIAIGIEGSGTLPVAQEVLAANGLSGAYTPVLIGGREAADALAAGEVDAAILVGSPDSQVIRELLENRALTFHGLRRERAYDSRFPRLATLTIGEGQLDLAANLPDEDRVLLAAAVTLVASDRFHPLSYADELYDLHLHIEWVIRRLERQRAEARQAESTTG